MGPIRTTLRICPFVFDAVAMTVLTLGSVLLGAVVINIPVCGPLCLTLVPSVSSPVGLGEINYNLLAVTVSNCVYIELTVLAVLIITSPLSSSLLLLILVTLSSWTVLRRVYSVFEVSQSPFAATGSGVCPVIAMFVLLMIPANVFRFTTRVLSPPVTLVVRSKCEHANLGLRVTSRPGALLIATS